MSFVGNVSDDLQIVNEEGAPEVLNDVNLLAGLLFFLLTVAFYMGSIGFVYFLPKSNPDGRTVGSLLAFWSAFWLWLPPAFATLYTNLSTNWRLYLVFALLFIGGSALYANQEDVDKAVDATETSATFPIFNNFVFPVANTIRMLLNMVLCFTNILANLTRIFTNQLFDIAINCDKMDWTVIPDAIRDFAINSVVAPRDWLASGFEQDLKLAPMIASLADILSAFNPIFDCQCNDLNFLWPIFINPSYGIIQSSNLHDIPEKSVNLRFENWKLVGQTGLTLSALGVELLTGGSVIGCNNSRPCQVERVPKFDNVMRLQCEVYRSSSGFLDDILYSIDSMIFDKLNLLVPWNSTPRVFGLFAWPLCAKDDLAYIVLDLLAHLDLTWRLDPDTPEGNYVNELRFDTLFGRFYNMTYEIEQIGQDLGGAFSENLFCLIGTVIRIIVTLLDYFIGLLQALLAYGFVHNPLGKYSQTARVQNIRANITADAAQAEACAQNLGNLLGHGGKFFAIGVARTIAPLVKLVDDFIGNSGTGGDVLAYLGSNDFNNRLIETFEGLNIIAGAIGGAIRSTGAFGSTTCDVRDIADDPLNLEKIEMGSLHLNIMCGIGTTVEMIIRSFLAILAYVAGIIHAFANVVAGLATGSPATVADIAAPFQTGEAFDLGRDNGVLETQCLLVDSVSLIPPSLLTLGPVITCPSSVGTLVAEVLYDVIRAGARTFTLGPFLLARAIFQAVGSLFCGDTSCLSFAVLCDNFIVPTFKSTFSQTVQLIVALIDLVKCLTAGALDSTLDNIGIALGKAFIDTRFGDPGRPIVTDCSDLVTGTDGGLAVVALCKFFSFLSGLIDFVLLVFEKGFIESIWYYISGALKAVLDFFRRSLECIWSVIQFAFNKLGECLGALVAIGRFFDPGPGAYLNEVEDECGGWGSVFSDCDLSFEIEEYGLETPLPSPGIGTSGGTGASIIFRPPAEMVGVCISPDQTTCQLRASTNEGHDGQSCASLVTGQNGVNRLVLGQTCVEALNTSFDPYGPTLGACCIPSVGCSRQTFSACNSSGNVWIENEFCSSLNGECRVVSSPQTTQFGCCVTDNGVDAFSGDLRVAKPNMNGYDCYKSTLGDRAYYIADDPSCATVDPRLLNESFATIDAVGGLSSFDFQRVPCTPESEIYKRTPAFKVDPACIVVPGPSSTNADIQALPLKIKIAGTGFVTDNDVGKYWFCHSFGVQTRNSYVQGLNFPPVCTGTNYLDFDCELDDLWNYQNQIVSFFDGTVKTTRFADTTTMTSESLVSRATLFDQAFTTECRFIWLKPDNCINFGYSQCDWHVVATNWSGPVSIDSPFARGSEGTAREPANFPPEISGNGNVINDGSEFIGSDCRFSKKGTPFDTPRFDGGAGVDIPAFEIFNSDLDRLSGLPTDTFERRMMIVLYGTNTTFDMSRDNTDARCNNYIDVTYPPAPVTTGTTGTTGSATTGGLTTGGTTIVLSPAQGAPVIHTRRLMQFEPLGLVNYEVNPINESHPCFMIYYYWRQAHNESAGLAYTLHWHLDYCIFSDSASYAFEAVLLWDSQEKGERLISPYFLYHAPTFWSTMRNATNGIWTGIQYVGYYFQKYIEMKNSGTPNLQFAVSWAQFAQFQNVTDRLGERLGSFIAAAGQAVAAADWQGVDMGGSGIFDFIFGVAQWSDLRTRNYTFPVRNSSTEVAPTFSDTAITWYNEWFNWTAIEVDGDTITENGNNLTLTLEYKRKLTNIQSFMAYGKGPKHLVSSAASGGGVCNPADRSCIDCELVVSTFETLVEVIENCVEDIQNTKRFNLDPTKIDLTRNNTFIQPTDALACKDPPPLEESGFTSFVLDFFDLFFDSRYWFSRAACYATNFDENDPHSPVLYLKKGFTCDPINDGSAHRGRGGIGLVPALALVTGIYIGLILLSTCFLPVIPTNWITFLVLYLVLILFAYWSSPACFFGSPILPIPVIVDALPDDVYVLFRNAVPTNCTQYHPDVASPICENQGREFFDCGELNFDGGGARHLAYLLESLFPGSGKSILDSSVPVFSALIATEYYQNAFSGIEDIVGTPRGEYCVGFSNFNIRHIAPLAAGVAQLAFVGLSLFALLAVFVALMLLVTALINFLVNFSILIVTAITRSTSNPKRYLYQRD